jgi:aminotransferase
MTGWRIGYLAGPESIIQRVRALKELCSAAAPIVSQRAGIAALTGPQDVVEEYRVIYEGRRRIMLGALDRMGFTYGEPRGAFYIWVNASSVGMDSIDLSYKLLEEANVLAFPGTGFGEQWVDYMRIAYLAPEDELTEALTRMERCFRP